MHVLSDHHDPVNIGDAGAGTTEQPIDRLIGNSGLLFNSREPFLVCGTDHCAILYEYGTRIVIQLADP
jgi:hypothetical protein